MKIFKLVLSILILSLSLQIVSAQDFVDDLYFNDTEVDYSFLYSNPTDEDWEEDLNNNDSIDNEWGEEISYEDRIRKFHNPYYLDYYWDYGWSSPTWYNSGQPSWGYNLNYHNYGWGVGIHYGSNWHGWHNPYFGYGWHNPYFGYGWDYGWNYAGYYNPYAANFGFAINSANYNISYGHRDSNNTNISNNNKPNSLHLNQRAETINKTKTTNIKATTNRPLYKMNTSEKPSQKVNNTISKKKKKQTNNRFEKMINEIIHPDKSYQNNNSSKEKRADNKKNNSSKSWNNNSSNRNNNRSSSKSRSNSTPSRRK
jgi:hypothetical protein